MHWRADAGGGPGPPRSNRATQSAPTTPVSWVLAPAASAMGVRDELAADRKSLKEAGGDVGRTETDHLLIGNPHTSVSGPHKSATTRWCRRKTPGRRRGPPIRTGPISALVIHGMANAGRPCGREPSTHTPARVARSIAPTTIVAPTTAIRMPGTRLLPFRSRITARVNAPTTNVVQLGSGVKQRRRDGQQVSHGACRSRSRTRKASAID